MLVFEFFSGIGGMHQALSSVPGVKIKNIFPFDINPNANVTYLHNFGIKPFEITIESFSLEDYEKFCCDNGVEGGIIWTMSPPCQPFTRLGDQKDLNDGRTMGFLQLIKILESTKYLPNYFMLENVKNFEYSNACALIKKTLMKLNYSINQFLLSPTQFGVPNSRPRFYLLARSQDIKPFLLNYDENGKYIDDIEYSGEIFIKLGIMDNISPEKIKSFLSYNTDEEVNKKEYYISEKILKKDTSPALDIVTLESDTTTCFTKGYGKLLKGSGSVLISDDSLYSVFKFNLERN
jgi:tRNA (cytosine38-C5)-methyltransferase